MPSTFRSISMTGNAEMLCCAIRLEAISSGSSGLAVITLRDSMSAKAFLPSAIARVMSHEVTMPRSLPVASTTTMWFTDFVTIRSAMARISSSSVQVTAGCMTLTTKGISSVWRIGLKTEVVDNRSTGEVNVNVPSSIHDFKVWATFLAIFKLERELTRTFLPLMIILPDLSSL